jgi:hypothetical protein
MTSASARPTPTSRTCATGLHVDGVSSAVTPGAGIAGDTRILSVTGDPGCTAEVVIRLVIEVQVPETGRAQRAEHGPTAVPTSRRGRSGVSKREVTFSWPADVVAFIRESHRRLRQGSDGLPLSAVLSAALELALDDPGSWLSSVRDDQRRSRPGVQRRQVSVQLPVPLVRRFNESWERLDGISAEVWGEGFRLTKAHLALAAVEYALRSAEDTLATVLRPEAQ